MHIPLWHGSYCVPVTGITLVLSAVLRQRWLLPFLVGTSVVGFAYMLLEMRALEDVGSCVFQMGQVRLSEKVNWSTNVLSHIVIPLFVILRILSNKTLDYWDRGIGKIILYAFASLPSLAFVVLFLQQHFLHLEWLQTLVPILTVVRSMYPLTLMIANVFWRILGFVWFSWSFVDVPRVYPTSKYPLIAYVVGFVIVTVAAYVGLHVTQKVSKIVSKAS